MQTKKKKKKRQKIGVTQFKGKRILCVLRAVVVGAEDMGVVDLADFISLSRDKERNLEYLRN